MSTQLLEILKKNQEDIKILKETVDTMKNDIEQLKNISENNSLELKNICNKSYYIERYLENIQNDEIEQLLEDEKIHVSDS